MRLSEHEQRVLAQLKRALTADDPRFVQQFAPIPQRSLWWRRLVPLLSARRPHR
jgi:hypothetical protein